MLFNNTCDRNHFPIQNKNNFPWFKSKVHDVLQQSSYFLNNGLSTEIVIKSTYESLLSWECLHPDLA